MNDNELQDEIDTSIRLLESKLEIGVQHYSYPEGQESHYDDRVIRCLQEKGITCSPTAIAGLNPAWSDPFHLRRVMVGFDGIPFPFWDASLDVRFVEFSGGSN